MKRLFELVSPSELSRIKVVSQLLTKALFAFAMAIVVIFCLEWWFDFQPTFWSYVWFFLAFALIRFALPWLWQRTGTIITIKVILYIIGTGIVGLGIYYLSTDSTKVGLRWLAFGIGILITANRVYQDNCKSQH